MSTSGKIHTQSRHDELIQLVEWIDQNTVGLSFSTDDRTLLAVGCFDIAIEYQAAIALLSEASLYGAAFALLRVLAESLVRGLWLYGCATDAELDKFKRGKLDKSFVKLIEEYEVKIETPSGVLSKFKASAWDALNGFTHTGFHQVSRRHSSGQVQGNYPDQEVAQALDIAGALGLIAAGQLIAMSGQEQLLPLYIERMSKYAKPAS